MTAGSITVLQRPEPHLQESESSALTFASNRACKGLRTQAPIDEKPVPHLKMPTATELDYCLLSSRSCVRITQGRLQKHSECKPCAGFQFSAFQASTPYGPFVFLCLSGVLYCLVTDVSKITALIDSGHHFSR